MKFWCLTYILIAVANLIGKCVRSIFTTKFQGWFKTQKCHSCKNGFISVFNRLQSIRKFRIMREAKTIFLQTPLSILKRPLSIYLMDECLFFGTTFKQNDILPSAIFTYERITNASFRRNEFDEILFPRFSMKEIISIQSNNHFFIEWPPLTKSTEPVPGEGFHFWLQTLCMSLPRSSSWP